MVVNEKTVVRDREVTTVDIGALLGKAREFKYKNWKNLPEASR